MKTLKRVVLVVMTILVTSILAACNTIHGAGVDISKGGSAIARAAK